VSFEIRHTDLAGRIGRLQTTHGVLETPAFMPVVHPVRQSVSTQFLKSLGFEGVITNAYIALRHYGDDARTRGIHDIINYDGVIMTDSGGYQVLEYGSVEITAETMAKFEKDIKSDIAVPLDNPTGYGLDHEKAKASVELTLENARLTLEIAKKEKKADLNQTSLDSSTNSASGTLWVGPVQGAEHFDLVEYSTNALSEMGFNLLALGSPVELMKSYEFAILAQMIVTAKKVAPSKPIHLFGAGHPLTIPLVIALGCDTFDSASYMLYAKDGRYMHPNGTAHVEELSYLSCQCPICSRTNAKELLGMDEQERVVQIAKHNLYTLKAEVDASKQAIMDGRLWEHLVQKARGHPKLLEAVELFNDFDILEAGTPFFKEKALFLNGSMDQYRPEAKRFKKISSEFKTAKKKLILYPESHRHPFYSTKIFDDIVEKFSYAQICSYNSFLGVIPAEISDIFPAAHNVTSRIERHARDYPTFIESLNRFLSNNNFEEIIVVADDFMHQVLEIANVNARIVEYGDDAISSL